MLVATITTTPVQIPAVSVATLIGMAGLGALGAYTGGAPLWKGAARVAIWGAAAMAVTAGVGALFGTVVG
jgi:VIT1/CCC1 family predicted Fe2+/Mn2+ transporter